MDTEEQPSLAVITRRRRSITRTCKRHMIATEHTQSLANFRQTAAETLDRLNQTGEPEIITVNGEVAGRAAGTGRL